MSARKTASICFNKKENRFYIEHKGNYDIYFVPHEIDTNKIDYKYELIGSDKEWIENLKIENLQKYMLKVKKINELKEEGK